MSNPGYGQRPGLDDSARRIIEREHAAEYRDSWRPAHNSKPDRASDAEEPCREDRRRELAAAVARLFADLRRRPRIAATDPCSQRAAQT